MAGALKSAAVILPPPCHHASLCLSHDPLRSQSFTFMLLTALKNETMKRDEYSWQGDVSYSCSHMNLHMLQVHTDVLCRTKLKLVFYLLFMLPNLPLPTVAPQPARALSTGKISPQSAFATLTILAGHLSPSQWSFCLHSAPQFLPSVFFSWFYALLNLLKQSSLMVSCK